MKKDSQSVPLTVWRLSSFLMIFDREKLYMNGCWWIFVYFYSSENKIWQCSITWRSTLFAWLWILDVQIHTFFPSTSRIFKTHSLIQQRHHRETISSFSGAFDNIMRSSSFLDEGEFLLRTRNPQRAEIKLMTTEQTPFVDEAHVSLIWLRATEELLNGALIKVFFFSKQRMNLETPPNWIF